MATFTFNVIEILNIEDEIFFELKRNFLGKVLTMFCFFVSQSKKIAFNG